MLKRFSTPNYLQFGPNWVQIGHSNPEIEKLESFEEDGKKSLNDRGAWYGVWLDDDEDNQNHS